MTLASYHNSCYHMPYHNNTEFYKNYSVASYLGGLCVQVRLVASYIAKYNCKLTCKRPLCFARIVCHFDFMLYDQICETFNICMHSYDHEV